MVGEADGFAEFVGTRQRRLQRAAWLLTGDWTTAEDLVQTALARAWRHWRRVDAAGDPDAYVRRILVNSFVSASRRRWLGERPVASVPDRPALGEFSADVGNRLLVRAALARLSHRQRAVLVLRYFDDLTEAQVADVMGCAVGTVKSTAAKALERLRADADIADLLERMQS